MSILPFLLKIIYLLMFKWLIFDKVDLIKLSILCIVSLLMCQVNYKINLCKDKNNQ